MKTLLLIFLFISGFFFGQVEVTLRNGAKIRELNTPVSNIIYVLTDDKKAIVQESLDNYFKVCVSDKCGYVNEIWVTPSKELENFKRSDTLSMVRFNNDQQSKIDSQIKKEKQDRLDVLSKKFGKSIGQKLSDYELWLGMTDEMVLASRGNPERINESVGSWGRHEQWIYASLFMYFENGKLTSYQRIQ